MSTFKNIDEAREFFTGDKFAMANGITIDELWEDGCLCSMELRADHRNAVGGVMGGVIFTLGDFAFAVASNNVHMTTVGQQVSISFLSGSIAREGEAPYVITGFMRQPAGFFRMGPVQKTGIIACGQPTIPAEFLQKHHGHSPFLFSDNSIS